MFYLCDEYTGGETGPMRGAEAQAALEGVPQNLRERAYLTVDAPALVAFLRKQGVPAFLAQTGGGIGTIYAGTTYKVREGGEDLYPLVMGPFDHGPQAPNYAATRCALEHLAVGDDWDYDADPDAEEPVVHYPATPEEMFDDIAECIGRHAGVEEAGDTHAGARVK